MLSIQRGSYQSGTGCGAGELSVPAVHACVQVEAEVRLQADLLYKLRVQLALPIGDRDLAKGCKQEIDGTTIQSLKGHQDCPVKNGLEGDGVEAESMLS